VHGWLDSPKVWGRLRDRLSASSGAGIAISLRRSGVVSPARRGAVLEAYAAQVRAQVDAAGLLRFVLVGHSMGGQISELVAAASGAACEGLVLVLPAPLGGVALPDAVKESLRARLTERDPASVAAGKRRLSVDLDDEGVRILVESTLQTPVDMAAEGLEAWQAGHLSGDEPSAYAGPVLVVASDDTMFSEEFLRHHTVPRFSSASLSVVQGAGHWAHVERSQAVAALIDGFVGRSGAEAAVV